LEQGKKSTSHEQGLSSFTLTHSLILIHSFKMFIIGYDCEVHIVALS